MSLPSVTSAPAASPISPVRQPVAAAAPATSSRPVGDSTSLSAPEVDTDGGGFLSRVMSGLNSWASGEDPIGDLFGGLEKFLNGNFQDTALGRAMLGGEASHPTAGTETSAPEQVPVGRPQSTADTPVPTSEGPADQALAKAELAGEKFDQALASLPEEERAQLEQTITERTQVPQDGSYGPDGDKSWSDLSEAGRAERTELERVKTGAEYGHSRYNEMAEGLGLNDEIRGDKEKYLEWAGGLSDENRSSLSIQGGGSSEIWPEEPPQPPFLAYE